MLNNSKIAIIGVAAVAILLAGAAVVFAQTGSGTYGPGMMGGYGPPAAAATRSTPGANGNGSFGPGMMGNGYYGTGNGNYGPGMMGNVDWNKMRDAANSGNWNEMYQACQDAYNSWRSQNGAARGS